MAVGAKKRKRMAERAKCKLAFKYGMTRRKIIIIIWAAALPQF